MLTDNDIRSLFFKSGLHTESRTVITRWKDGIDLDFPTWSAEKFARAVEAAAYERAAQEADRRPAARGLAIARAIRALAQQENE